MAAEIPSIRPPEALADIGQPKPFLKGKELNWRVHHANGSSGGGSQVCPLNFSLFKTRQRLWWSQLRLLGQNKQYQ